ncbi:MAG: nucleoside-diphosphate kinase, partial [Myxococcota bacterium]
MAVERTLSIIKPDATENNNIGNILALIEKAGLKIVDMKLVHLSKEQAEGFYAVHKERPFFGELVEFMTRSPVVVSTLEGEDAVAAYRKVMGATNPAEADEGTIRKLYAKDIGENS